jgi:DNA sulfur modification protein DndC
MGKKMKINTRLQPSLFEDQRMGFAQALDLSIASLNAYGSRYKHWAIAYSGGKDSSATTSFVSWAIKTGQVQKPESLTVMYADTRMELTPLRDTAVRFMDALQRDGINARVVLPTLNDRFMVYLFGRGVPPPKNRFRWCTPQIKVEPMEAALLKRRTELGEKFLMLTGVRMGESAIRDARITLSCSRDSGECGQGWFQTMTSDAISDQLAPLLHWRQCFVWDWLNLNAFESGYPMLADIAEIYGEEEARTGCVGCNLTDKDTALENLIQKPKWAHLAPLMELRPLYRELAKPKWRIRKSEPGRKKNGAYAKNGQRMGPLTMEGRAYGLDKVLDIQRRAGVDLINGIEERRIRKLWALDTWPDGWEGDEIAADVPLDSIKVIGDYELVVQPRLV